MKLTSSIFFPAVLVLSFSGLVYSADDIAADWAGSPHADSQSESFTHWNDDGKIPANCAACHSGTGFLDFLGEDGSLAGKTVRDHETGSVVGCGTCHNDSAKSLTSVTFPSGVTITDIDSSAQCLVCHQGRASTQSVTKAVAELGEDDVSGDLGFINIHYRAAAATLYGTEVQGGYEYPDKSYFGQFTHVPGLDTCSGCHDPHSLEVKVASCSGCHAGQELADIRMIADDIDGDGNKSEGVAAEIETLHDALGNAIVAYSSSVIGKPAVYHASAYPYFFVDSNDNQVADANEAIFPNRYRSWTPRMLKAAYNYQFVEKDPGGYAHNPKYLLQLMFDSLSDLRTRIDVDLSSMVRP